MTRRKPKVRNHVNPHNAEERVIDTAFEAQVRELTTDRKWSELRAAFLLHGSALTRREERWTDRTS